MIEIRLATFQDSRAIASIHLASKVKAESGIVDSDFLASKTIQEYESKWQEWLPLEGNKTFLAEKDTTPAGIITIGPLRTAPPGTSRLRPAYVSEIYALYVHPDFQRLGIGKALFSHACKELLAMRKTSVCLWALEKNSSANRFYEVMGGKRIGNQTVTMGRTTVKEVCYGWRDITSRNAVL